MKYILILFVLLTLASCSNDTGNLCGDYLSLKLNQSKTVAIGDEEEVSLKLIRLEDNRCPADIICIRAGEALVDLRVNDDKLLNFCLGDCPDRNAGFIQADTVATVVNDIAYKIVLRAVNSYRSSIGIVPQTACFEVLLME